ncbi:hypothetical protein GCM10010911_19900 [Paenibacillus nasutitermitis]|uniref:Uncharacterized protein n=1 Tax=Paenibacillus nasutitermitis TaxID=1652958 RepID=A0A916YV12_9BACL|nr:hypothetical protein GCM10010911_19900 [Paenibacillus nasutitermitis]
MPNHIDDGVHIILLEMLTYYITVISHHVIIEVREYSVSKSIREVI